MDAQVAWLEPAQDCAQGGWSWELRGDEVADVTYRGRLLLRSVRAVSRDRDWGTRALVVEEVVRTSSGVRLAVGVRDGLTGDVLLHGALVVEVDAARLRVAVDLEATRPVWTNRTGLVVLHPPQLAGTPLRVVHPDGSLESTSFPRRISPHQPALDITELAWRAGGLEVTTRFEGDVFEMEDQRNWTDASFKTYSRPLSLPFPYRLEEGERVVQRLELDVAGGVAAGVAAAPDDVTTGQDERSRPAHEVLRLRADGPFPRIALGASTAPDPAPAGLDALGDAVLVELELGAPQWRAALHRARSSGSALDVRVVLDPDRDDGARALQELCRALVGVDVVRTAVFDARTHCTDAVTAAALRNALRGAGISAPVLGGARSHFTELNREQTGLPADVDGVVFSITPLFHASGTEQLVESVAVQRTVAEQAVAIAAGRPVHIGPVTLRPRFNNVATTRRPTEQHRDQHHDLSGGYGAHVDGADDERQSAPQLATWTIASAAALAVPGVESLTYFEEWGPRGVRTSGGSDLPVAEAVRALVRLHGSERLIGASPDGLVWALGGSTPGGTTVLVANLGTSSRQLLVETPHGSLSTGLPPGSWSTSVLPT